MKEGADGLRKNGTAFFAQLMYDCETRDDYIVVSVFKCIAF